LNKKNIYTRGIFQNAVSGLWKGGSRILQNDYYTYDSNHKITAHVECFPSSPNPICDEWMSPSGFPNIIIHYTLSYTLLDRWRFVRSAVDGLVKGFIVRVV
jgi:hypothetical protein